MVTYKDIYEKICRMCLKITGSEKMETLIDFTDPTGLSCFGKAVPNFARISYSKEDKLPKNICQMCIYLLKHAIHLKFTCELSEKLLKTVLENNVKNKSSDDQIQENICQYVMYRHYFPVGNGLNKKKSEKCRFPKKDILKVTSKNRVSCIENLELNKKQSDLITDLLQDECDNDMTDYEDNSNNITEPKVKPTLNYYSEIKNPKREKNHLLDKMRDLIEQKNITNKAKRQKITKQRDIPCEICNKILANQFTYDQHMQRHNICRYICDKCGKGFPILTELNIHQISRHGIGPYLECNSCGYKAPTKLKLTEHIRLHTGERPYTCDKCGLTFRRQAIWRNHQILHTEKRVQCKICPQKFYRRSHMLAHMNNVHERKYVYICSVCDVTYAKTKTVRRHMIIKHGIKRELQGKIRRLDKSPDCFTDK